MAQSLSDDNYGERETERRREAALQRMFATPHKPHKPPLKKEKRATPK